MKCSSPYPCALWFLSFLAFLPSFLTSFLPPPFPFLYIFPGTNSTIRLNVLFVFVSLISNRQIHSIRAISVYIIAVKGKQDSQPKMHNYTPLLSPLELCGQQVFIHSFKIFCISIFIQVVISAKSGPLQIWKQGSQKIKVRTLLTHALELHLQLSHVFQIVILFVSVSS